MMAASIVALAQAGGDTLTKHQALAEHLSMQNEAMRVAKGNPAIMEMAYGLSLTQFSVSASWQEQSAPFVLQKGNGHTYASVNADTYLRLSDRAVVWGKASYTTGKNRDIKWSSIADYDILQPDILGDTVGGDTRREKYVFEGGYASQVNKWRVGGEMLFRAEQEYRKVDPRMRSIVSDLTLRAGATRQLGETNLGLSIEGNIYRQTGSVDFYKPLGSVPEYQLMGLGTIYTRFSGDINDLFFKGGGIKLQADLIPSASGVFTSLWMSQHSYERIARLLNSLPLTTLYNKEAGARVGWKRSGKLDCLLWADVKYNYRTSDQHLAGTSSSQIYPVIADLTMYKNHIFASSLTAIVGRQGTIGWNVKAQVGFLSDRQKFVYPHRAMNHAHVFGEIAGQAIARVAKSWTLTGTIEGGYNGTVSNKLSLPLANMESHVIEMVEQNYRFLTADYCNTMARLRADYHFKSHYSVFMECGYGYTHCSEHEHQHNVMISIGVNL